MSALHNMVENQLRCCSVSDEATLTTLQQISRADFVPQNFVSVAYSESCIPLGEGETMLTPFMEASILQALQIKKNETALVIGTGSGYLTALIASQAQHVFSVDINPGFVAVAQEKLKAARVYNVTLESADASLGFDKNAPYDVIVIAAGVPFCSDSIKKELSIGGRLFAFVGKDADYLTATIMTKQQANTFETRALFETGLTMLHHHYKALPFQF